MVDEKKVEVSQEQVEAVNKEVEAKTEEKIEAKVAEVKAEVKAEVASNNEALKAELAKIRAENEARELEQQINMEREKAKAAAQAPVQKHVVPETKNPTQPNETPVRELSQAEGWAAFEQATRGGEMSADTRDIASLPQKKQD